ncbi:MAG: hypothetical protein AAFV53_16595, partial [Myxococcota bacterium]
MGEIIQSQLVGLLVPWRLSPSDLDAARSSYSEDSPQPGVVDHPDGAKLHLETSGEQDGSTTYVVTTRRPGHVRPGGAGGSWYKNGDAEGLRDRGWDPPISITHHQFLNWSSRTNGTLSPHATPLPTGEAVVVATRQIVSVLGIRVSLWRVERDGSVVGPIDVYTQGDAPGAQLSDSLHPSVCVPSDGSLLVGHLVRDSQSSEAQWRIHRSTDKGDTWTEVSRFALDRPINIDADTAGNGHTIKRARMAAVGGEVSLLFWGRANDTSLARFDSYHQYASSEEALRFDRVQLASADIADADNPADVSPGDFGFPDLIAFEGQFLLQYAVQADIIEQVRLPDAYAPISGQASTRPLSGSNQYFGSTGTEFTDGDWALWSTPSGTLYATGRIINGTGAANHAIHLWQSTDGGRSWEIFGGDLIETIGNSAWWYTSDDYGPVSFCACAALSGSFVFALHESLDPDQNPGDARPYEESLSLWQ